MSYPLVPKDLNVSQNRRNTNLNSIQTRKARAHRQDVVDLVVSGTQTVSDLTTKDTLSIESTKAASNAISIEASNAAGGVSVVSGTGGVSVTTSGNTSINSVNTIISSTTTTRVGSTSNIGSIVYIRGGSSGAIVKSTYPSSISNVTTVLTAPMIGGGTVECTSSAGAVALTTATAALIVASLNSPVVGDTLEVQFINSGANTATLTGGSGVTIFGNNVIASNSSRLLRFRLTNVTASSEAVRLTM